MIETIGSARLIDCDSRYPKSEAKVQEWWMGETNSHLKIRPEGKSSSDQINLFTFVLYGTNKEICYSYYYLIWFQKYMHFRNSNLTLCLFYNTIPIIWITKNTSLGVASWDGIVRTYSKQVQETEVISITVIKSNEWKCRCGHRLNCIRAQVQG